MVKALVLALSRVVVVNLADSPRNTVAGGWVAVKDLRLSYQIMSKSLSSLKGVTGTILGVTEEGTRIMRFWRLRTIRQWNN